MIEGVKVEIKPFMADIDFNKLLKYCLPFEDGHQVHTAADNTKTFLVHPSHIQQANKILKHYGIFINVNQEVTDKIKTKAGKKAKMPIEIKFIETGVIIQDENGEHFIPSRNMDVLFNIIKEGDSLTSREIFSKLIHDHNLFPVYNDVIELIKASAISQTRKDMYISAMMEYRNSAFEGLRASKENKEDKTDYYYAYWFVSLALRRLGLIELTGTGGNTMLTLTEKGKGVNSWKEVKLL